ncbi:Replication initiator protein A [Pelagimonas phthalicica]|uniref:Replication initiator protein A n=1 Tax=Pelagimonas phthalicica TaxID=1037362 RepID=A0A238J7X4_9RHOB|nr:MULTISPECIES: replication initiator protein A [Roseobacteraceae]MBO9468053.1 replication initiator protein A [Tropicibacter sp. R15_0]TDS94641.1 replication initiator protein A [Pelagimonas phthalicica]SMX26831.1 Replication initiator protein A [Pelagimonas phthalicica]
MATGTPTAAGAGGAYLPAQESGDFFVCDLFGASPKDDLGSMEHPIFSLATRQDRRVLAYEHNGVEVEVTPSVKGRATIHDKDILIYCISQLMAGLNAGRDVTRKLTLTAHDLLMATQRDTSGDAYHRLKEAFERLAGTRITTNISVGDYETTSGFGLIESWEIVRKTRGGRMVSVTVVLSEWLFRAVLNKSVLTLSRDYFKLRKPLERRVYELARKHCGRQRDWQISIPLLHKKSGSSAPVRVFRAAIRKMIAADHLPDYHLEELEGDILRVSRRDMVVESDLSDAPILSADALEAGRALWPGADIYALEAEWRAFWVSSGRIRLQDADKAFLGWIKTRKAG